jgi:hypothetical protein
MSDELLIGYLFNALDPEEARQVENALAHDLEWQRRRDALAQMVNALEADREHPAPPPGLRHRVIAHLAEVRCEERVVKLAPPPLSSVGTSRTWWRRADVLVAASLLLLVAPLVGKAVSYVNYRHNISVCQNNLRTFYTPLMTFADLHQGHLPQVEKNPPWNRAEAVVPILYQNGLGSELNVQCPSGKNIVPSQQALAELAKTYPPDGQARDGGNHPLIGSYAYTLGYADGAGNLQGMYYDRTQKDNDLIPIMADRPPFEQLKGIVYTTPNSLNHGERGQNVLYLGGAVTFMTSPQIGLDGDNIYLNQDGRIAHGLHRHDSVLGASNFQPFPPGDPEE